MPSNLTGPEIQKPKEQRVDMGEFTEVKTDSVSMASSSVWLSASLIAYFTYSCQKMSSQVKYYSIFQQSWVRHKCYNCTLCGQTSQSGTLSGGPCQRPPDFLENKKSARHKPWQNGVWFSTVRGSSRRLQVSGLRPKIVCM